jgi:hypothetical protein
MLKYNIANSQESEISSGTPYKTFIESKEQEKASKIKERAERQLNGLEAAQKEEKSGGLKSRNTARRKLSAPMPFTSKFSSSICEGYTEIFEEWLDPLQKLSGMVARGLFQLGRRWQFSVCPRLNLEHAHSRTPLCTPLSAQVSKSAHFANFLRSTTANITYVSCQLLCLAFLANRRMNLGMYCKLIYCPTYAEAIG